MSDELDKMKEAGEQLKLESDKLRQALTLAHGYFMGSGDAGEAVSRELYRSINGFTRANRQFIEQMSDSAERDFLAFAEAVEERVRLLLLWMSDRDGY